MKEGSQEEYGMGPGGRVLHSRTDALLSDSSAELDRLQRTSSPQAR